MRHLPARLLVVTDRKLSARHVLETVAAALQGGANWFWLRDRDLEGRERERLAHAMMQHLRGRGFLTIGGDVELARIVGAHGVQLSAQADVKAARLLLGQDMLIGVSAHVGQDVEQAQRDGADYVTLSPVFPSASKPGYGPALGVQALAQAGACGLPVVALGGVTAGNAAACIKAGASGVAVMGGVFGAPDACAAAKALVDGVR
ncbi:MAG: thiamine monophosphate synthase [Hyphomicrobiales bacterium]|nr:thiamine monophosphate synthase [Hyphomicrobiales bacterium]